MVGVVIEQRPPLLLRLKLLLRDIHPAVWRRVPSSWCHLHFAGYV